MKRQGIFLRTVKSRNRGRASERAVCGVFSDFSLAEPASRPAYAPATTSPARCRAGRAKQHNHARNVKPLPPRRSPGRTLPGQEGVKGDTCLSPSPFSLPFGKKRKNPRPSILRSLNEHRLLHLLLPHPRLLPSCARPVSPCLRLLTSPRTCS